uniref:Junctional cadherin complex regulator n=1 Tax=Astyanax mexicanus TaxID=7994 RepID=A0A8B9JH19_ASTMX
MDNIITKQRHERDTHGAGKSKTANIKIPKNEDSSPRSGNASPTLWDSLESDTESLVQEKAYQRELKQRIVDEDNTPYIETGRENSVNEDRGNVNSYRRTEAQHPPVTGIYGVPGKSTTLPRENLRGDDYDDLRYDPDWRKKLAGAEFLQHVQTSLSLDSSGEPEDMVSTGRHEYIVVKNPASAAMDIVHPSPPSSSFHLHPQQRQFSHEDTMLSVPQSSYTSSESTPRLNSDRLSKTKDRSADHLSTTKILHSSSSQSSQQRDSNKQYDREDQSRASAQGESKDRLNLVLPQRRHSRKVKEPRPREDIVERNKATLGRNTHKQGSYLKAYGQRGKKQDEANELTEPSEDTASIDSQGSPDNALDSELMWIQKTQKLKVHKETKRSDGARHQRRRPRPRIQLNPHVERRVSEESLNSAPAVNLNMNLNTPAKLAVPFLGHELQEHVYTLAPPQWRNRTDVYSPTFIHPGYAIHQVSSSPQLPVSVLTPGHVHVGRNHPQVTDRRMSGESILRVHENSSARIAPNWPFSTEKHSLDTPEVVVFDEGDSGHTLRTNSSNGYPVLPPIGRSNGSSEELYSDRTAPDSNAMQRSCSEGYLAQLEKQRQLKARTYKEYTLKDYKSLNQQVKLGGLGPSNTVDETMAEKIRRQKLYSNVIREQNKKISRIPFLSDRNPVGSENKDAIPRKKALEYAKTIAKPKAPQQQRVKLIEKRESEDMFEHSAYLQLGVDVSQIAALEVLRKRHEQEKQAVARFAGLHGGLSAPSVNTH